MDQGGIDLDTDTPKSSPDKGGGVDGACADRPGVPRPLIANETNHFRGTDTPGNAGSTKSINELISPDDVFSRAPWQTGP